MSVFIHFVSTGVLFEGLFFPVSILKSEIICKLLKRQLILFILFLSECLKIIFAETRNVYECMRVCVCVYVCVCVCVRERVCVDAWVGRGKAGARVLGLPSFCLSNILSIKASNIMLTLNFEAGAIAPVKHL